MEINRRSWSQFCRRFNTANQYRSANMTLKYEGCDGYEVNQDFVFTGLLLKKTGRQVSGIELFADGSDPDGLGEPVISIEKPKEIVLKQGEDGTDKWLTIGAGGGAWASILFIDTANTNERHEYVEKIAYEFSKRRGFAPGGDLDDWLNAERVISEAELQFVQ